MAFVTGLTAAVVAAAGGTPDVEVVFSRALTSPTSLVPGAVNPAGVPVSTRFGAIGAFWLSPDGSRWMLLAATSQSISESAIMLAGAGGAGTMLLQEARPFPGSVGSEVVSSFGPMTSPFNQHNDRLVSVLARGGSPLSAQKLIRFTVGGGQLAFQSGGLYSGVQDRPPAPSGDEQIGDFLQSAVLMNDGAIGWCDDSALNLDPSKRPVVAFNAVKHVQGEDLVLAIDGVTPVDVETIAAQGGTTPLAAAPDRSRIVLRASVNDETGTPQVVIVDGVVRLQVGYLFGDSPLAPIEFHATFVAPNGDWYARGMYIGPQPWAARNGAVIARAGFDIGGDTWTETPFYALAGNINGDWVLAGKTSRPDAGADDVIAVNGQVVLREGDPVVFDIDGGGQLDDTAYVGRGDSSLPAFIAHNVFLSPDRTVYALVNLRTAAGADLGGATAFIRIHPSGCQADFDHNGMRDVADIFAFLSAWFQMSPGAEFDGVAGIGVPDIFAFLALWFAGC